MDTAGWIIVAVVVAIAVVGALFAFRLGRERRLDSRREEADALRDRAQVQAAQADQRAQEAEEQAREARRAREAADAASREADDIDPDVDTSR